MEDTPNSLAMLVPPQARSKAEEAEAGRLLQTWQCVAREEPAGSEVRSAIGQATPAGQAALRIVEEYAEQWPLEEPRYSLLWRLNFGRSPEGGLVG